MSPQGLSRIVGVAILLLVLVIGLASGTYIVPPGHRGVLVTLGKVSEGFKPEGFGLKMPFISEVIPLSIRQRTVSMSSSCISKDLQEVQTELKVLYRVPEESVVQIYQQYKGDPFVSLIKPRIDESIKNVAKNHTAQEFVQERASIKSLALDRSRQDIGSILDLVDVVLEDISLSPKLEAAIERKMVQEQEANKAIFMQQQAEIEAQTAIIRARGEAESIRIRGEALASNPELIDLEIVETWNGSTPRVVDSSVQGASMILPLGPSGNKPISTQ